MQWLPVLKVGLWNAWIPMLFVVLHPQILHLVDIAIGTGKLDQKMGADTVKAGGKKSIPLPTVFLMSLFVLTIFIHLKLGVFWLYIGVGIYVIGISVFLSAITSAARTPDGAIFTSGMYRFSRHPLYLSFLIIFVGISVASLSWILLLLSSLWMIFPLSQVNIEEIGCLEQFGADYQAYMQRTPKWLGLPKSDMPHER